MEVAALDDSTISKNGIYVYSHGLVVDGIAKTIVFVGNEHDMLLKNRVSKFEKEIYEFVSKNLEGLPLYACAHYRDFSKINRKVKEYIYNRNYANFSRDVRKAYIKAHHSAKDAAYEVLKKYS